MRARKNIVSRRHFAAKPPAPAAWWRFPSAERGNAVILFGLAVPVLVGAVGLAIDVGQWELANKSLQRAADAAAISAAVASQAGGGAILTSEGKAIAADYGFVDGSGGTKVTVNRPPTSGAFAGQ